MLSENNNLWVFKAVTDEDRSYRSIESYNDDLMNMYAYDNFVPNHKQIKKGDWVIVIDKKKFLGFAKIGRIEPSVGRKNRNKCPICGTTNFEARKNKQPLYRCNRKHEFDHFVSEIVDVIKYESYYERPIVKPAEILPISYLRPFYNRKYNRNMSVQSIDIKFFDKHFQYIPKMLSAQKDTYYLNSADALTTVTDSASHDDYKSTGLDERTNAFRQIKERRGQTKFRNDLIQRYGAKCMVTGCILLDILEAAHINPYRGENDNHPSNGLLLRSDIHTLFDLDLIGIDPENLTIHISERVQDQGYKDFHLNRLHGCELKKPDKNALEIRWIKFMSLKNI